MPIRSWHLLPALLLACGAEKKAGYEVEPAPIVIVEPASRAVDASANSIATDEPVRAPSHEMTALEENIAEIMNAWSKKTHCDDFDYFPEGGYKNFWCHRPEILTQGFLEARSHAHVFLSGPHANAFTSTSKTDFGHYDPAFVKWLADDVAPSGRGSALRIATQAMFDQSMRPLAKIFYWTRAKTIADAGCFQHEKDAYAKALAKKSLPEGYQERWFFFMNPYFCPRVARGQNDDQFYYDTAFDGGFEGNVAKTAVGFWIRRALDGTLDEFSRALGKLVAAYMPELPNAPRRFPDATAIDSALSTAQRSAASCRDQKHALTKVQVKIAIAPNGSMSGAVDLRSPSPQEVSCVQAAIAAVTIPAFDGETLHFARTLALH